MTDTTELPPHMTDTDRDIEAIRAALEACPHKGAWLHRAKSNGLFTPPPEGTLYTYGTHLTQLGDDAEGAEDGEVIDFIAACHPERIARLLDALEAATKDAARLRELMKSFFQSEDGRIEWGWIDGVSIGDKHGVEFERELLPLIQESKEETP